MPKDPVVDREVDRVGTWPACCRASRRVAETAALAEGVRSQTEAIEVTTAARLDIGPDTPAEQTFLADLATRLRIAPELAAQIDTAAKRAV